MERKFLWHAVLVALQAALAAVAALLADQQSGGRLSALLLDVPFVGQALGAEPPISVPTSLLSLPDRDPLAKAKLLA